MFQLICYEVSVIICTLLLKDVKHSTIHHNLEIVSSRQSEACIGFTIFYLKATIYRSVFVLFVGEYCHYVKT